MTLNPYLNFDGTCEAALKFYEKALSGKIQMLMTYGESPMAEKLPPDWGKKIIHATLNVSGQVIGAADAFPGYYKKPQGFSVTLNIESAQEADSVFKALSDKADIQMPIQETFWALRFGMLTDQFGTPW